MQTSATRFSNSIGTRAAKLENRDHQGETGGLPDSTPSSVADVKYIPLPVESVEAGELTSGLFQVPQPESDIPPLPASEQAAFEPKVFEYKEPRLKPWSLDTSKLHPTPPTVEEMREKFETLSFNDGKFAAAAGVGVAGIGGAIGAACATLGGPVVIATGVVGSIGVGAAIASGVGLVALGVGLLAFGVYKGVKWYQNKSKIINLPVEGTLSLSVLPEETRNLFDLSTLDVKYVGQVNGEGKPHGMGLMQISLPNTEVAWGQFENGKLKNGNYDWSSKKKEYYKKVKLVNGHAVCKMSKISSYDLPERCNIIKTEVEQFGKRLYFCSKKEFDSDFCTEDNRGKKTETFEVDSNQKGLKTVIYEDNVSVKEITYSGTFNKEQQLTHGTRTVNFADGEASVSEGNFENDKLMIGNYTKTSASGVMLMDVVCSRQPERVVYGSLYNSDGTIKYKGHFNGDISSAQVPSGHGTLFDSRGNIICKGNFADGKPCGRVIFYFSVDGENVAYDTVIDKWGGDLNKSNLNLLNLATGKILEVNPDGKYLRVHTDLKTEEGSIFISLPTVLEPAVRMNCVSEITPKKSSLPKTYPELMLCLLRGVSARNDEKNIFEIFLRGPTDFANQQGPSGYNGPDKSWTRLYDGMGTELPKSCDELSSLGKIRFIQWRGILNGLTKAIKDLFILSLPPGTSPKDIDELNNYFNSPEYQKILEGFVFEYFKMHQEELDSLACITLLENKVVTTKEEAQEIIKNASDSSINRAKLLFWNHFFENNITLKNGDNYVGEIKNGEFVYGGTYTYRNGDVYVGEFTGTQPHGQGILKLPNGDQYIGTFKAGKATGEVVLQFANHEQVTIDARNIFTARKLHQNKLLLERTITLINAPETLEAQRKALIEALNCKKKDNQTGLDLARAFFWLQGERVTNFDDIPEFKLLFQNIHQGLGADLQTAITILSFDAHMASGASSPGFIIFCGDQRETLPTYEIMYDKESKTGSLKTVYKGGLGANDTTLLANLEYGFSVTFRYDYENPNNPEWGEVKLFSDVVSLLGSDS